METGNKKKKKQKQKLANPDRSYVPTRYSVL